MDIFRYLFLVEDFIRLLSSSPAKMAIWLNAIYDMLVYKSLSCTRRYHIPGVILK